MYVVPGPAVRSQRKSGSRTHHAPRGPRAACWDSCVSAPANGVATAWPAGTDASLWLRSSRGRPPGEVWSQAGRWMALLSRYDAEASGSRPAPGASGVQDRRWHVGSSAATPGASPSRPGPAPRRRLAPAGSVAQGTVSSTLVAGPADPATTTTYGWRRFCAKPKGDGSGWWPATTAGGRQRGAGAPPGVVGPRDRIMMRRDPMPCLWRLCEGWRPRSARHFGSGSVIPRRRGTRAVHWLGGSSRTGGPRCRPGAEKLRRRRSEL